MKKWIWIIFLINLAIRLFLLNWNTAEYTDSIRWMHDLDWMARVDLKKSVESWRQVFADLLRNAPRSSDANWLDGLSFVSSTGQRLRGTNDPPLYPATILLFNVAAGNRETAGKLVSILSASLTIFPLFFLARRVYGNRVGIYTILLYTVSPPILRWSIRVMAEATYTLFMVLSLWLFIEYCRSHRIRHLVGSLLVAAVAPLAHIPGRVLLGPAIVLFSYFTVHTLVAAFRSSRRRKNLVRAALLIIALLPVVFAVWAVNEVWYSHLAQNLWYQNQMKLSLDSVVPRMGRWISEYLLIFPHILTYPVALFTAVGLVCSWFPLLKGSIRKTWILLFLGYCGMIFAGIVINKWWTARYLYALVPFSLVIAAGGIDIVPFRVVRVKLSFILFILCFVFSAGFSIYVLCVSRDSFGDLKRTALYIRDQLPSGRVWSDEIMKTNWWSQRHLQGYTARNRHEVRPGDYVVLHSWGGTNIPRELAYLRRNFDIRVVHEEKSWIIPILADDLLEQGANHPGVAAQRFKTQNFLTLIIQILQPGNDERGMPADGLSIYEGMLTYTTVSPGHNLQVWRIQPGQKTSDEIIVRMAHAADGNRGAFEMVSFADTNGDGAPDKLIAKSLLLQVKEAGTWSTWTFNTREKVVFVGNTWYEPALVYYDGGVWADDNLETTMYYSNSGDVPSRQVPNKITNIIVLFGGNTEDK